MLKLYSFSGSPYAWRVELALALKQLPYEIRRLSLAQAEHRTPEFLALSPRGRIPVLCDGDVVLSESLAILAYLEASHPQPLLFGRSAADTGRIWRVISEYTSYVDPSVEAFILPIYFDRAAEQMAEVRRAASVLEAELASYDAALGRAPLLAGEALTAADLVVYPHLKSVERALGKPAAEPFGFDLLPLELRFPALVRWMRQIEALPGYDRTYPPHWR